MTQTFDEMAAQRDPLYAAMQPHRHYDAAVRYDRTAHDPVSPAGLRSARDAALLAFLLSVLYHDRR